MHDLYRILGVSEDDVDIDLRYRITYILHEGILDLSEAWVHRPILERFRGYTHRNAIRMLRIAVASSSAWLTFTATSISSSSPVPIHPR